MEPNLKINTLREIWQQSSEQHWLPVQGISMLPMLHQGDDILISHDLSTVRRGDILVFHNADGLVAHRVIQIVKQPDHANIYKTRGDNCTNFDSLLSEPEVLGWINSIRKNGREFKITTPSWRIWNNFLATYYLLIGTLRKSFRHIKQSLQK